MEDIKKEVDTKDEDVENTSNLHDEPLVAVKVEALQDMKIEHDEKDQTKENPVEVFLMEPNTEVKDHTVFLFPNPCFAEYVRTN